MEATWLYVSDYGMVPSLLVVYCAWSVVGWISTGLNLRLMGALQPEVGVHPCRTWRHKRSAILCTIAAAELLAHAELGKKIILCECLAARNAYRASQTSVRRSVGARVDWEAGREDRCVCVFFFFFVGCSSPPNCATSGYLKQGCLKGEHVRWRCHITRFIFIYCFPLAAAR